MFVKSAKLTKSWFKFHPIDGTEDMSLALTRDSEHEETLNPWVRNALEHGTFPECKSAAVQLKLELQKLSESHKVVS